MSSAAAASCDDEVGGPVGARPVQPEERLEVRGRAPLRPAHEGALLLWDCASRLDCTTGAVSEVPAHDLVTWLTAQQVQGPLGARAG